MRASVFDCCCWLIVERVLAHLEIGFLLNEIVQERAEQGGQGIGDQRFVIGVAWRRPVPVGRAQGDSPFVEELFLQGGALREVPDFHEMGGIGFGGEAFFAEPMDSGEDM